MLKSTTIATAPLFGGGRISRGRWAKYKRSLSNIQAASDPNLTEAGRSDGLGIVDTTAGRPSAFVSPYSVSLFDAFKFNGPAPEKINGRLAMLALSAVMIEELQGGGSILEQILQPSWSLAATALLIIFASLVPIQKGAIEEPFYMFTPAAERLNGRLAMLGFAALLALEWYTEVPFF